MTKSSCQNCNQLFTSEYNYCPNCGAHIVKGKLTTKEVLKELFEVILLWNREFLKTVVSLFIYPSKVVLFYLNGGRNRYMNPIFYLLLCYFLYLLVVSFTDQEIFFISMMKNAVEGFNLGTGGAVNAGEAFRIGTETKDIVTDVSNSIANNVEPSGLKSLNVDAINKLNRYSKILFFLLIIFIAWCSKLVFKSSRLNYAENLSINAYLFGQIILLGLVLFPVISLFSGPNYIGLFIIVIYLGISQYLIFQSNVFQSIIKTITFIVLSIFMSIILFTLLAIILAAIIG